MRWIGLKNLWKWFWEGATLRDVEAEREQSYKGFYRERRLREHARWTQNEMDTLKELWDKGEKVSQIAVILQRTPGAIYVRAVGMGLVKRGRVEKKEINPEVYEKYSNKNGTEPYYEGDLSSPKVDVRPV